MISINVALAILVMIPISGVLATSNTHENCIDIDSLKEKLRLICEPDPKPEYLDCENILRCIDAGEQQIMRECVKGYPADNETESCNSQDLLYRSWCEYTRGAISK
jgi:hypothetical protein